MTEGSNGFLAGFGVKKRLTYSLCALAVIILIPFLLPSDFYIRMITEAMIVGLYVASYDILIGYTGVFSFGHAMFYGLGAYAFGILIKQGVVAELSGLLAIAIVIGAALAVGYASSLVSGIKVAILTLASNLLILTIVEKSYPLTHGTDGLRVPIATATKLLPLNYSDSLTFYYFVALVVLCCGGLMYMFIRSPLGHVWAGARDNLARLPFLGYDCRVVITSAFIVSAFFSGIAGMLGVLLRSFVAPSAVDWVWSGEALILSMVGGVGTLIGPFLGGVIFTVVKELLGAIATYIWLTILGAVVITVIYLLPRGMFGWLRKDT